MSGWKKITKAIQKPFKELGKGWWTDVRAPVVGLGAGALTAGVIAPFAAGAYIGATTGSTALAGAVGGSIAGSMGTAALVGGGLGLLAGMSHEQAKAQAEQLRIQQETAQKELEAAFTATLKPDVAPGWETQSQLDRQAADARARKRAFTLSRTVNRPLSLGTLAGRQTLG